jgi:indolepyruvate ferredoxin oxidoreductase, beta subunit
VNELKQTSIIDRPICLLLGALGGQGGGVLIDWLVDAAKRAGYPAQATSTPGVAQRTGATTYYFELFPEKNPAGSPIFTFFPASGDLDLMIAMEPTEAGRAIERGFVTDCTTVISATERVYSTAEKVSAGDGRIDVAPIIEAIDKASKELIQLDMAELSAGTAARGNAIAFGAVIGSGILPLTADECRASIAAKGVAVESNLAGFDIGLKAAQDGTKPGKQGTDTLYNAAPDAFISAIAEFPAAPRGIIGHGIARLIDYQNDAYARTYLERLKPIAAADSDESKKLTGEVARHLARWMSFEDVIRVAQLKTRPNRLARIRDELKVDASTPLVVTDYFKPGRDEMLSVVPKAFSWLVPNLKNGMAVHMKTGSAFGYAMLKFMAALKPLRARSAQNSEEQAAIEQWLSAVIQAAASDNYLACQTANLAIMARGYGRVRKTGLEKLKALFSTWENRLASDHAGLAAEVDQLILLANSNPDAG